MKKIRSKLISFYKSHKRMPSYAELAALAGYTSKNAAHKLALKLEEAGIVERDSSGKLIPAQLYGETRVLGTVEAGFPSPAEEELLDTISFDEWLIEPSTFMVKVDSNAMQDAGLKPGDIDGVACAGESPTNIAHYLGIVPTWVDGTQVGGCSFMLHVRHAAAAINEGLCSTVLITHGESGRSRVGTGRRGGGGGSHPGWAI